MNKFLVRISCLFFVGFLFVSVNSQAGLFSSDSDVDSFLAVNKDNTEAVKQVLEQKDNTNSTLQQQNEDLKRQIATMQRGRTIYQEDLKFTAKPAVICRDYNCSRMADKTTSESLYTSLFKMFYYNKNSKADICDADPMTRACLYNGIRFGANIAGNTPAVFDIKNFTLFDVDYDKGFQGLDFNLQPNILVNGIKAECSSMKNKIQVGDVNSVVAVSDNFYCNMTSDGQSTGSMILNIDYMDFDYNVIGAYYIISFDGGVQAGKTGYMIMKLPASNSINVKNGTAKGGQISTTNNRVSARDGGEYVAPGQFKIVPIKKGTMDKGSLERVEE